MNDDVQSSRIRIGLFVVVALVGALLMTQVVFEAQSLVTETMAALTSQP